MVEKGFFLVIDGIDGCGKTIQTKILTKYLRNQKISVYNTSEPSKGELGVILRNYLKKSKNPPVLDALIFAADRIEHCKDEIKPHLDNGEIVISDRYRDSSYVYQSVQGKKNGITMDWMRKINKFSISPDLILILDLDPKIALQRKIDQNVDDPNAIEKFETIKFQKKIRTEFLKLVKENNSKNENYRIIDADQSKENVFEDILRCLKMFKDV